MIWLHIRAFRSRWVMIKNPNTNNFFVFCFVFLNTLDLKQYKILGLILMGRQLYNNNNLLFLFKTKLTLMIDKKYTLKWDYISIPHLRRSNCVTVFNWMLWFYYDIIVDDKLCVRSQIQWQHIMCSGITQLNIIVFAHFLTSHFGLAWGSRFCGIPQLSFNQREWILALSRPPLVTLKAQLPSMINHALEEE